MADLDCRHAPNLDQPELLARTLVEFYDGLPSAGTVTTASEE